MAARESRVARTDDDANRAKSFPFVLIKVATQEANVQSLAIPANRFPNFLGAKATAATIRSRRTSEVAFAE